MITYDETIQIGFKRNTIGFDPVWFNEFGYEYFITEKRIIKKGKFKLLANWFPNTQEIEVMHIQNEVIIAKTRFNNIEKYKEFEVFFIPIAI